MLTYNFIQAVPYLSNAFFYQLLCGFNCSYKPFFFKFAEYKRLEQFKRHCLWKAALMQFKFRAYHNNRTSRIINSLSQEILSETPLFTFYHIAQGFKPSLYL